jgi:DNA polymerase III subunit epsilon
MENHVAVIDVETTGLNPYRYDRIVELAIVIFKPGHGVLAELDTLLNPERDIGPISIHGIAASDVINAPRFADITDQLGELWRDAIALVGHNVRFDVSFLRSEYARIGIEMPDYALIDTMVLAGGGCLSACCAKHDIEFDGRMHSALHDARATANLFQKMSINSPELLRRYEIRQTHAWPIFKASRGQLLPRSGVANAKPTTSSYAKRLADCLSIGNTSDLSKPDCERDYRCFLWRVLEDGKLEESEEEALLELATHWGLNLNQVRAIHLDYLAKLAKAVCTDGSITDAERREVRTISYLLGFGLLSDEEIRAYSNLQLLQTDPDPQAASDCWRGKTVCFTGECCCRFQGQLISREMAEQLAINNGLQIAPRVTKKLDLLIVSDPNTQSSKAKKARQYGIRIVHEPVFWRSLGVQID